MGSVYPESMESSNLAPGDPKGGRVSLPLLWLVGLVAAMLLAIVIVGIACFFGGRAQAKPQALSLRDSGGQAATAGSAEPEPGAPVTPPPSAESGVEPEPRPEPPPPSSEPPSLEPEAKGKSVVKGNASEPTAAELRLPGDLSPIRYHVGLKLYLPADEVTYPSEMNFTFDGSLELHMECLSDTATLVLNAVRLNVSLPDTSLHRVSEDGEEELEELDVLQLVDSRERLGQIALKLGDAMKKGQHYRLKTEYRGLINSHLAGLYRSSYREAGRTKWLAVTQFQPIDARSVFPSFDEPAYKAVFGAAITHPASMKALSNGQEDPPQDLGDGWARTDFADSPKMSTYLVAYAVADFAKTEKTTKRGVPFRIWARPDFVDQTSYAADIGPRILDHYEEYFGTEFPLPKQDMIALPDFEAGAMENWGLITYREKYLLYDPANYEVSDKVLVARVIAHELGHMWFGNLVTMRWWDDLWLNEGFATMMEYVGTAAVEPAARMWEQFVGDSMAASLSRDAEASSHPLFVPIQRVKDIDEVFDAISYDKGAVVLRMIQHTIGQDTFQKGLQAYIDAFSYDNTVHGDFWGSMSETTAAAGDVLGFNGKVLNVSAFAASWTRQMAYPVVSAVNQGGKVYISQSRFKINPNSTDPERYSMAKNPFGYQWTIPIWYQTKGGEETQLSWLRPDQTRVLTEVGPEDWVVVNPERKGLYRVAYDEDLLARLKTELEAPKPALGSLLRYQLLDDAFNLAKAGRGSYADAIRLTNYLDGETEWLPWSAALGELNHIADAFESTPHYELVRSYLLPRLSKLYARLNWDSAVAAEDPFENELLGASVGQACHLQLPECLQAAREKFAMIRAACGEDGSVRTSTECNPVKAALRGRAYCYGVRHGSLDDWEWLWRKFSAEEVSVERERLMRALTCTRTPWLLTRLLHRSIAGEGLRPGDVPAIWYRVGASAIGGPLAWDYFRQHFPIIADKFKDSTFLFKYVVIGATRGFHSRAGLNELKTFMAKYPKETNRLTFEQALDGIQTKASWHDQHYEDLVELFTELNQ